MAAVLSDYPFKFNFFRKSIKKQKPGTASTIYGAIGVDSNGTLNVGRTTINSVSSGKFDPNIPRGIEILFLKGQGRETWEFPHFG